MRLARYAEYKNSQVDWLGDVPAHWESQPLKHVTQFVNGRGFAPSEWSDTGVPIIRIENLNGSEDFNYFEGVVEERYEVQPGSLLFGWSGNRGTSFGPFRWTRNGLHYLNQHIFRLKGFACDPSWLYWCLVALTRVVEDAAHGIIGMVHITKSDLGALKVPLPPPQEQRAIAAFLDRETARIDALIEKKRRVIELLQEKRAATIFCATTSGLPSSAARAAGLDPHPTIQSSGVNWIGGVPEHWEVGNLRRFAKMRTGHTPSRTEPDYWEDCEIPWFTLADVWQLRDGTRIWLGETKERISCLGLANSAAELLPAGTVVFSRTASVGFSGIMPVPMATTQDFWNWIPGPKLVSEFLLYQFRAMSQEFAKLTMGSTHKTIYQSAAAGLCVCVPPINEQLAIVSFIREETAKIDGLITKVESVIERLNEYRSALCAAAVSGQIDVREAA